MSDETREAVARAILNRRVEPDFRTVVDGAWIVDHDLELADAALKALHIGSRFTVEGVECVVAVLRCEVTGNPVGTDTRQVGFPCRCENCSPPDKRERAAALQALADLDRDLI